MTEEKKKTVEAGDEIPKLKKWRLFFGILAIAGVVNTGTMGMTQSLGVFVKIFGIAFASIFGASIGAGLMTFLQVVFNLALIWIIVWIVLNSKISKLEKTIKK